MGREWERLDEKIEKEPFLFGKSSHGRRGTIGTLNKAFVKKLALYSGFIAEFESTV